MTTNYKNNKPTRLSWEIEIQLWWCEKWKFVLFGTWLIDPVVLKFTYKLHSNCTHTLNWLCWWSSVCCFSVCQQILQKLNGVSLVGLLFLGWQIWLTGWHFFGLLVEFFCFQRLVSWVYVIISVLQHNMNFLEVFFVWTWRHGEGNGPKGKKTTWKKERKGINNGIILHFSLKFHTKEIVLTNHSETSSRKAQTITPNHFLCGRADAHAKHQQYMWMDLVSRKR